MHQVVRGAKRGQAKRLYITGRGSEAKPSEASLHHGAWERSEAKRSVYTSGSSAELIWKLQTPGGLLATDQPGTFAVVSRSNVNQCNACERLNRVLFLRWDGEAVTEIGATLKFDECLCEPRRAGVTFRAGTRSTPA